MRIVPLILADCRRILFCTGYFLMISRSLLNTLIPFLQLFISILRVIISQKFEKLNFLFKVDIELLNSGESLFHSGIYGLQKDFWALRYMVVLVSTIC